jgi:hypothetical protein
MKSELFEELLQSVREGGAILRGKVKLSCTFVIEVPDVKRIRRNYRLSQQQFASLVDQKTRFRASTGADALSVASSSSRIHPVAPLALYGL